ncbi:30S ribosomal protein S13 [Candidatus Pacearchaeota archaeon]|nr:30S ribosomal protein S13 [Candidatus Pacearchaeota archaeon]
MAEENKKTEEKVIEKEPKVSEERLIRILGKDISGRKKVLAGLISVKGISWSFANAVCKKLKIDKNKKIGDLSEAEKTQISDFVKNPNVPSFLKNRRKDFDSGEDKHLNGSDLDLRKDFDIKRLRKIRAYRGARHAVGLPTRGQRTKSNFRKNRKKSGAVGVSGKGKR